MTLERLSVINNVTSLFDPSNIRYTVVSYKDQKYYPNNDTSLKTIKHLQESADKIK